MLASQEQVGYSSSRPTWGHTVSPHTSLSVGRAVPTESLTARCATLAELSSVTRAVVTLPLSRRAVLAGEGEGARGLLLLLTAISL